MTPEEFIKKNGVTKCPTGIAQGIYYYGTSAKSHRRTLKIFSDPYSNPDPEQTLAIAKILLMLQDLGGCSNSQDNEKLKLKNDAYRFFFSRDESVDFESWCDSADLNPTYVRKRVKLVLKNGIRKLRADPGTGNRYLERKKYRSKQKEAQLGQDGQA